MHRRIVPTPIAMNHRITLTPSQHIITARDDESILDAALRQGVSLPYGCRDGVCGACRAKVTEGPFDHGDTSEHALPQGERAHGFALLCRARAQGDLTVSCRVEEADAPRPRTLPCRVRQLTRPAEDVTILQLRLPASERFEFRPGQYLDILLGDGRRRSFSIANAPREDGTLELHIRHVPGGAFTERVFTSLKERDILRFEGPLGSFRLLADGRDIVLLAGGTGFAPVKAILEAAWQATETRPIRLYWGARNASGLYLDELARGWAASRAGFEYVPVLSEPDATWQGRTGLVHEALMADLPDMSGATVYACGAPAMIAAARKDLTMHCRLPETCFLADAFTFSSDSER